MGKKVFISDCEGPVSINDNAFELAGHYIEDGEKFFAIVSKYDDILVDEVKREGYYAGGTLKLIVPFLKAYGANNKDIVQFCKENVLLVHGAKDTLQFVNNLMPSFIVSTSYNQYIEALCDLIGFPFQNTYSTKLDLDNYSVGDDEREKLKKYREMIIENPDFDNIDNIFWREIITLPIHEIMKNVNPVGGEGKKEAIIDILNRFSYDPRDIMYVGDSITDVEPLKYIKECGGLAISFNGNEYAVREAEIAIMADNTVIISIIAYIFNSYGKEKVIEFIKSYMDNPQIAVDNYSLNNGLKDKLKQVNLPKIAIITSENFDNIVYESKTFRNLVRGELIGALG